MGEGNVRDAALVCECRDVVLADYGKVVCTEASDHLRGERSICWILHNHSVDVGLLPHFDLHCYHIVRHY